ncbi:hypothetical protein NBRC116493_30260 [Aurantivibrio infirmus]
MRKLAVLLIRGYRYLISPLLGNCCRFYPSCSHYGEEAIQRHGIIAGGWLTTKRILKCHPWHPGGIDEVPDFTQTLFFKSKHQDALSNKQVTTLNSTQPEIRQ